MRMARVPEETIHRCIQAACARSFPRQVKFCPWCGAAQQPGAAPAAPAPELAKRPAPAPPIAPAAAAAAPPRFEPPRPAPPPPPRPPPAAAPPAPTRRPVQLRWWIIGLGVLWLVWLVAKPSQALIERRMEQAVALARQCKARAAQDELIALRSTRASSEQLRQVQEGLNAAAAACTRAEQRRDAWFEARGAVEKLIKASSWDKARARLAAFTRRWGEDDNTRALRKRIDAGKREHPLADPARGERTGAALPSAAFDGGGVC